MNELQKIKTCAADFQPALSVVEWVCINADIRVRLGKNSIHSQIEQQPSAAHNRVFEVVGDYSRAHLVIPGLTRYPSYWQYRVA